MPVVLLLVVLLALVSVPILVDDESMSALARSASDMTGPVLVARLKPSEAEEGGGRAAVENSDNGGGDDDAFVLLFFSPLCFLCVR